MKSLFAALERWISSDSPVAGGAKIALFIVSLALLAYVGKQLANVNSAGPCSPNGFPGRCYHVSEKLCAIVWTKAEATCKQTVARLALSPGRLTGPIIARCQMLQIDQAFDGVRKGDTECEVHHRDLIDWQKRNGF
ncbi:MAG: hypothetical protein AB7G93_01510 [Bdellovibrionales bacterium]